MKLNSLKFKLIFFTILVLIGVGLILNSTIKNNNIKNSNVITTNNKTQINANKNEEINIQKTIEIKKQQQIKQKKAMLEKTWKIGYDEFFEKKYVQAIETERKVIKEDPGFYKAYAVEGIALAYSGNYKDGITQIDYALKLKPDYGYARFNKALANELFGHDDEAIEWYKKDLNVETFEWSYYGIASIYGRKGDIKNTIKYLKLAIAVNPTIKDAAKNEEDFDNVRAYDEFKNLTIK